MGSGRSFAEHFGLSADAVGLSDAQPLAPRERADCVARLLGIEGAQGVLEGTLGVL